MSGDDDALRQQTLDEIKAFGVTHMRVLIYWTSVAPDPDAKQPPAGFDGSDPNAAGYNWAKYDTIFQEAKDRGISIVATLTGPVPTWATGNKNAHLFKPDPALYEQFVEAAGKRYGDQVDTWTIWNEPNQPQFLGPQFDKGLPESPTIYRGLYKAALTGLSKAGQSGDTILAGETSPRGNGNIVGPVTFAKDFLKGKKLRMDGYAQHPYTTSKGPHWVPPVSTDVTISVLDRLTKTLDKYSKHKKLPLYLTEFGIQSKPDPYAGVSFPKQNDYRNIAEKIAYDNPRVAAFSQYLMRDDKAGKGIDKYGGFESGLRLAGGKKKLAYDGYRLPVVATQKGTTVKLWGLVRPATGATSVKVQQRDSSGWKTLGTKRTNSRGYWTSSASYRKGRTFRVIWTTFTSPAVDIDSA